MSDLELTMMRRVGELKAEVERLKKFNDEALAHIAKEERKSRERLEMAEDENARLKADVSELADGLKLASEVGIKMTDEVARLKAEVERLTAFTTRTIIPNEELQAQVERLTKAGDAMWNALLCSGCSECMGMYDCHDEAMGLWKAAKEGKQP